MDANEMPGEASSTDTAWCPECGAEVQLGSRQCWLCGSHGEGMAGATAATVAVPSTLRRASFDPGGGYSLASLLMFVTLASVVFGVSSLAPGIGVPLGMVALLVWLRTAAVARHRQARGELLDHAERAQLFVRSFGVALALIALTCVAGCAAFFAACFACIATFAALEPIGDDTAMAAGYIVHGIVGLAIVVPTLWFVAKMVRRRWRRDIGEGYGMESPPHNDST